MLNEIITPKPRKITEEKKPFTTVYSSKPMLYLKNVGRLCVCGCTQMVIGPRHKKFATRKCSSRDRYIRLGANTNSKRVQARIAIDVNYDGTRNISIYYLKRIKRDVRITKNNCSELWDVLNQISEFRNKPI